MVVFSWVGQVGRSTRAVLPRHGCGLSLSWSSRFFGGCSPSFNVKHPFSRCGRAFLSVGSAWIGRDWSLVEARQSVFGAGRFFDWRRMGLESFAGLEGHLYRFMVRFREMEAGHFQFFVACVHLLRLARSKLVGLSR